MYVSQPQTLNLESKNLLSGPLYCAGREGLAICVFRGFQILVLCVSGISQGRSCRDPGMVDAKEMNDSGIWQIQPVFGTGVVSL